MAGIEAKSWDRLFVALFVARESEFLDQLRVGQARGHRPAGTLRCREPGLATEHVPGDLLVVFERVGLVLGGPFGNLARGVFCAFVLGGLALGVLVHLGHIEVGIRERLVLGHVPVIRPARAAR